MTTPQTPTPCSECGQAVPERPTTLEYEGQDVHVFHPILCRECLFAICERYSVECANCGGKIPPFTQVGILKADQGQQQFVHMNTACTTVGSAFHGYLGRGETGQFIQVEAC